MNDQMKTSKNGLEFIARWEGCVLKPYKDIAGLRTIGFGHLIKPGENFPDEVEITKEKAYELLANDVVLCESAIKARIKVPLNQNQFDALVSFGFNCGTGVYVLSDACKALNAGKYEEVPEKLLAWSKVRINGVLQTNKGLLNRRKSEGELFSKAADVSDDNLAMSSDLLKEIQSCLKILGLYSMKIDGVWGGGTLKGLQDYAKSHCIQESEFSSKHISKTLLLSLKNSSNCRQ